MDLSNHFIWQWKFGARFCESNLHFNNFAFWIFARSVIPTPLHNNNIMHFMLSAWCYYLQQLTRLPMHFKCTYSYTQTLCMMYLPHLNNIKYFRFSTKYLNLIGSMHFRVTRMQSDEVNVYYDTCVCVCVHGNTIRNPQISELFVKVHRY